MHRLPKNNILGFFFIITIIAKNFNKAISFTNDILIYSR